MTVQSKPHTLGRKVKRIFLTNYQHYILMLPAIIAVAIFAYYPMYGVQIAFKDYRPSLGIWGSEWVGLKHFIRFVTYPNFWMLIKNTLSITLYSLATFPLTLILALLINEIRNSAFKKTVQMVSYAPHFLSVVVICGIINLFMDRANGIFNNFLVSMGGERISFLTTPEYFASIYVWSGVWQSLGWGTIVYLAALAGVSPELVEAAKMDGAQRFHIIWHINIPTILPTVIILFILSTGNLLSVGFEKIFLLQNNLNLDASQVIATYVYSIGIIGGQFSYSSAIGLFNNVVNIIVVIIVNTISKRVSEVSLW